MGKYALLIVAALIFSMITYSYALRNALFISNARTIQSYSQNQAHNIAQSAAMAAYNNLRGENSIFDYDNDTYNRIPENAPSEPWDELHGDYILEFTRNDSLVVITSSGIFEEVTYQVNVGLIIGGKSIWSGGLVDKAIHAESSINLGNGDVVGGVSLNNPFSSFSMGPQANISDDIMVYDSSIPTGSVELPGNNDMTVSNMAKPIIHEDPVFPQFPQNTLPLPEHNGQQSMYPEDYEPYFFDSFSTSNTTINTNDQDRTLHVNNLDLSGGLELTGDGALSIYVEESLNLGNGSINDNGLPENLNVYYKGSENVSQSGNGSFYGNIFAESSDAQISIGGNPTFKGNIISFGNQVTLNGTPAASSLIYAPNAHVTLRGTGNPANRTFYGAIVSDSFEASGQPIVEYDPEYASTLPELEQDSVEEYTISFWN